MVGGLKKATKIFRINWAPAFIELGRSKIRDRNDRHLGELLGNIKL